MNFNQLVTHLLHETTGTSLGLFGPEILLCVTIVSLLLIRLFDCQRWFAPYWMALLGSLCAFGIAYVQFMTVKSIGGEISEPFFTGLLVYDNFTVFFRLFLLLFLILVIALTVLSGRPSIDDGPDFYTLLLGATIGMMLMVSANHLLILFLGIEMTSVPSYVMVGFLRGNRKSSEAAFKYVVYGAGAAGVMLYGISLLSGLLGTAELPALAGQLVALFGSGQVGIANPMVRTVVFASMLIMVGLSFKLSLVPFHFWCPDAFEGASAEVAGFLSVGSKAAAFALLVRFCLALSGTTVGPLANVNLHLGIGLGVIAVVTVTFGNLAAYTQTNVKRLLAYSTISHAGYMLMAVSALMVVVNGGPAAGLSAHAVNVAAVRALEGLLYYLTVYLFMNLGAFAIVALIRNEIGSEEIADYKGLARQTPLLCVCMLFCMFSLIGAPPFGGFVGKLMIFNSLVEAAAVHWSMWVVLAIGGLNVVFGLFYYLRVLNAMFLQARPEGAPIANVGLQSAQGVYVLMVSVPVLLFGIAPGLMEGLSRTAGSVAAVLIP